MKNSGKLKRTIAVYLLIVPIALMPVHAQAGLKEAMNELFVMSSTNPRAYETQRLMGVYGGSMSLRSVGRPINIVQVSAPRIDAGCGGIDMFFGSFSFINGEQFEQILRSIASAAVGYAIKAALNWMCNPCGAIVAELEGAIRELNAMAKNTCAISLASVTASMDKIKEHGENIGKHMKTAVNRSADTASTEAARQSETSSKTAKGGGEDTAPYNPLTGNIVYRASIEAYDNGSNVLKTFVSRQLAAQLIMSLYSTKVINPDAAPIPPAPAGGTLPATPPAAPPAAPLACPAATAPERCNKDGYSRGPVINSLAAVVSPGEEGISVHTCNNAQCTEMGTEKVNKDEWAGVRFFINEAMFGSQEPGNYTSYAPDSLAGHVVHKGTMPLSAKANALLQITSIPVLTYLLETQRWPSMLESIAQMMAAGMVPYFEYEMASALHNTAMNAFTEQKATEPPQEFLDYLQTRTAELSLLRPPPQDLAKFLVAINDAILAMQKLASKKVETR